MNENHFLNENKVAVITGVSQGIGKAIADKFESESIKVVGLSRSAPQGACRLWVEGDITLKESREKLKEAVLDNYGRVDILVNNAGMGLIDTWEATSEENLKKIFELNFFSLVETTRLFLPELVKSKGSIINVASFLGKYSTPCMGGYCASKSAVVAFSDSLRAELKTRGVHVLNLVVGLTKTGFERHCLGSMKLPEFPGVGNPERLAKIVYRAYLKRRREIYYPGWYVSMLAFARLFPQLNDNISIKKWNLK